ncbi:CCA tRNA nucleotidyltransferase 1, mitochondrial-like [Rhopilema esculentum]|uniref:CCA tRNA nucleotidyltransferase 1, mitochondrial-like n=1 Tax=Rhopilema esculentum TaxID=499914 RepID=UPI0031D13934
MLRSSKTLGKFVYLEAVNLQISTEKPFYIGLQGLGFRRFTALFSSTSFAKPITRDCLFLNQDVFAASSVKDFPCRSVVFGGYLNRAHGTLLMKVSSRMAHNLPNRHVSDLATLNLSAHKIFRELLTEELLTLVKAFLSKKHEVRIVGGAVRDILLSRHLPKDIDLATTATPDEMIKVFMENEIRYIETGLQHGTLTAHMNGHNFEITTLRIDTNHDGRRAVVEFTNDWKLDAERRDLTINAMSIDFDGNLYDYFGGVEDLKAKHVRFVGDPEKRIREDYLRILRYFRFYGRISETEDDHVKSTLEVIKKCSSGLKNVAVERVWTELSRIVTAHFAPSLLKIMYELGVAENIGLPPCTQKHLEEFEYVWNHGHAHRLEPVTILMTLVDTVDEAERVARSLKLSSAERNLGKFIVTHRMIHNNEDIKKPYKDILASCTNIKAIAVLYKHVNQLLLYQGMEDLADEISNWKPPEFPITGNDIKNAGVKPGPALGRVLHELRNIWMESYYELNKDELLEKVEHIKTKLH